MTDSGGPIFRRSAKGAKGWKTMKKTFKRILFLLICLVMIPGASGCRQKALAEETGETNGLLTNVYDRVSGADGESFPSFEQDSRRNSRTARMRESGFFMAVSFRHSLA